MKDPDTTVAPAPKKRGRKYQPKFAEAEAAAAPAAPGKKAAIPRAVRQQMQEVAADGDLVDIWERRMLNPNFRKAPTVHIKTPGMHLRWINCAAPGRYHRARYEQGWIPVVKTELVDEREIFGIAFTPENYVCRGEKCREMLMKMPEAVFRQILKRRTEENRKSVQRLKPNLKSAGAKHFGDKYSGSAGEQAADAVDSFKGDIKFGEETISSDSMLD